MSVSSSWAPEQALLGAFDQIVRQIVPGEMSCLLGELGSDGDGHTGPPWGKREV